MENIQQLINNKNYFDLVEACEQIELQAAIDPAAQQDIEEIYIVLLIAYALVNDLNAARFLRKRILAQNIRPRNAQIDAAWRVCVVLWERRYPDFYEVLGSFQWSPLVLPLMEDLRESLREKLLELFQKSYTLVDIPTAVKYFGLPEADLIPALTAKGWQYDTQANTLTPAKNDDALSAGSQDRTDLSQISRLANVLLSLEQF